MEDPLDRIVKLWSTGIMVRHDGEYEKHYPERRDAFVNKVRMRAKILGIPVPLEEGK